MTCTESFFYHFVNDDMQEYVDPRDVKMNELEKVIAQYQDKLNDVTSNYQQKIGRFSEFVCQLSVLGVH